MIKLVGVEKTLGGQPVLRGVDLTIPEGKLTTIIGGSGWGKSVLLKHMIGLMQPDRARCGSMATEIAQLQRAGARTKFGRIRHAVSERGIVRFDVGV